MKKLLGTLGLVTLATSVLAGCGEKAPAGFVEMKIDWATPDMDFWNDAAIASKGSFSQAGVTFTPKPTDFTVLQEQFDPGADNKLFSLFSLAVSEAQFPNPYSYWHSENNKAGGQNSSRVNDDTLDRIIDDVQTALTEEDYFDAYKEYLRHMNQEMYMLPMYSNDYHDLFLKDVEDMYTTAYHGAPVAILKGAYYQNADELFKIQNRGMAKIFNPFWNAAVYDVNVTSTVVQSTHVVGASNESIPFLVDQVSDGSKVTLTLKDGITANNGKTITADDLLYSYLVTALDKYDGRYSNRFISFFDYIKKVDSKTVELNFKEATYLNQAYVSATVLSFSDILTGGLGTMPNGTTFASYSSGLTEGTNVYKASEENTFEADLLGFSSTGDVLDFKSVGTGDQPSYDKLNDIATGYYTITRDHGDANGIETSLVSNHHGVGSDVVVDDISTDSDMTYAPVAKTIRWMETPDASEYDAFRNGDLYALFGAIQAARIDEVRADSTKYKYSNYPRNGYGYTRFRTDYGPFKHKAVRQGVAYIINREGFFELQFASTTENGKYYATSVDAPYAPAFGGAKDIEDSENWISYKTNTDKAEELFKEAGMKKANGKWYYPESWDKE